MKSFQTPNRQPEIKHITSYSYRRQRAATNSRITASAGFGSIGKLMVATFLVGVIGFWLLTPTNKSSSQTLGVQEQIEKPKNETQKELDHTQMAAEINAVISEYPGMDIGVSWVDIKTGQTGNYGVQNPFVAASTAKLLTAIAFLRDVENGTNSLDEMVGSRSAKDALEAMIVRSDNQAWADFNTSVLSHQELATYASSIGLTNYDPDRNTITPADLARLLSDLYQHRLINKQHTTLLLSYMERAYEAPVQFIPNLAPSGVKVYHKPGYLTDRLHDAAIIDNGTRPYVLIVFSKSRSGVYNSTAGTDVFTRIANASFDSFLKKD